MRQASFEELAAVPGVPRAVAEAVYLALHPHLGAQSTAADEGDRREAS
ncbi:MAG: hypothetical protein M3P18_03955 [Actinomycetota bacterium]|nr:hypothetical protein [Actinomycetota bacterium]